MAYTHTNKLNLILDVQNVYNAHKKEGVSTMHVYRTHIKPLYHISRATFYNYLSTPAKKKLGEISTPLQSILQIAG